MYLVEDDPDWIRERLQERLHIVDGVLKAFESWDELPAVVWSAANRVDARRGLMDRFGFDEQIAQYVMDMPIARTTESSRADLAEEAANLRAELD